MARMDPASVWRAALVALVFASTVAFATLGCSGAATRASGSATVAPSPAAQVETTGSYVAGDLHTHTVLTDGSYRQSTVVAKAFGTFGLGWMANSEHGGVYLAGRTVGHGTDPYGVPLKKTTYRWWELRHWSYPIIRALRAGYPDKNLIQGVEWNVPGHDHASVGIVGAHESTAVSDFEYIFDSKDTDTSRSGLRKHNRTHADALAGVRWLERRFPQDSYFIANHPSRLGRYSISALRELNDAAPTVAFGFEGLPGYQKYAYRGNYKSATHPSRRTYGGADIMVAKVGGVWDALLGEGRRWWSFAGSDFHNATKGFWPGEYARTYSFVRGADDRAVIESLRSGDSWSVAGGLITALEFTARPDDDGSLSRMGGTVGIETSGTVEVTVRFLVPRTNSAGRSPRVDHIDVIKGDVGPRALPGTAAYSRATNRSARVVARLTAADWDNGDTRSGWHTVVVRLQGVSRDSYIRLRGTNVRPGTARQTDAAGNPLSDRLAGVNTAAKAWSDSWFYSNPIFIDVE